CRAAARAPSFGTDNEPARTPQEDAMPPLATMKCEACRADSPTATPEATEAYMRELPDWRIVEKDGIPRLERVYTFSDFVEALRFTTRVGEIAEEAGHHPALLTEWGRVTVSWWTHKIRGLHRNDFIMAARTDELASSAG